MCSQSHFSSPSDSVILQCTTGTMSIEATAQATGLPIFQAGIIPASAEMTNMCESSSFVDDQKCSNYLKMNAF